MWGDLVWVLALGRSVIPMQQDKSVARAYPVMTSGSDKCEDVKVLAAIRTMSLLRSKGCLEALRYEIDRLVTSAWVYVLNKHVGYILVDEEITSCVMPVLK